MPAMKKSGPDASHGWGHEVLGLLCLPTTIPNNFEMAWFPPLMSVTMTSTFREIASHAFMM